MWKQKNINKNFFFLKTTTKKLDEQKNNQIVETKFYLIKVCCSYEINLRNFVIFFFQKIIIKFLVGYLSKSNNDF